MILGLVLNMNIISINHYISLAVIWWVLLREYLLSHFGSCFIIDGIIQKLFQSLRIVEYIGLLLIGALLNFLNSLIMERLMIHFGESRITAVAISHE